MADPKALPSRPTPAQRKAAEALALSPEEQAARWKTHSGSSERLLATYEAIGAMLSKRFRNVETTFQYNMRGFAIRRRVTITDWKGTINPNVIYIGVAERKQGMTIHLWNPYDPGCLKKHGLEKAGFKPMVGCVQYNRKGDVPVAALAPLLDEMQAAYDREA